jgi:hypothetical protein
MSATRAQGAAKPIDRLLPLLSGVKASDGRWMARCPAHDDHTPSLSIAEGEDQRVLLHCFGPGCKWDAIARAVGLDPCDLFGRSERAVYPYGPLRRKRGRSSWEVPDAQGGWRKALAGEISSLPHRLYRGDEAAAAHPDAPVFIVEGEKDVETLRHHGFIATTSGGATSWRSEFAEAFRGRHVVVLPDQDEAGAGYLKDITRDVAPIARSFRVVAVPIGKDVTEFLEKGGSVEQLDSLAAEAESSTPPLGTGEVVGGIPGLLRLCEALEPEPVSWFWGSYVPIGFLTSVFANGGVGKSWLLAALSFSVCLGRSFLDLPTQKGLVLWIDAEGMTEENTRRFFRISRGLGMGGAMPKGLYHFSLVGPITTAENLALVRSVIEKIRAENGETDPLLIILDSFTAASFTTDPLAAGDVTGVLKLLANYGTLIFVDHVTKAAAAMGKAGNPFGSIFKRNFVRSSLELCATEDGGFAITHEKCNLAPKSIPIFYAQTIGAQAVSFQRIGADDPRLAGLSLAEVNAPDRVYRFLSQQDTTQFRTAEIAEELEMPESTVANALGRLKRGGKVEQPSRGLWRAKSGGGWLPTNLPTLKGGVERPLIAHPGVRAK